MLLVVGIGRRGRPRPPPRPPPPWPPPPNGLVGVSPFNAIVGR